MQTIREIAEQIAGSPAVAGMPPESQREYLLTLDKTLRNLTQRTKLQATEIRGRAAYYDEAAACAVRILLGVADFGLSVDRARALADWMQKPINGTSPIREAVCRAKAGETFAFEMFPNYEGYDCRADWVTDERASEAVKLARATGLMPRDTRVRLSVPASEIIREYLEA